ncbi:unnamed protein product [Thelazia callipaeda]|uniref:BTB domain-containing protein n=1 Tax=Thelazia callipaeda TaxID=103827 RepID=A0A0N5CW70_THECL|nr:unnamed protein product [Thelazia callipaeda]
MASVDNIKDEDTTLHLGENNFQENWIRLGEYLCEMRRVRDFTTVDIGIICANMETDFLHSSVGAIHSTFIRGMLYNQQTPLCITLPNCQFYVVSAVIDWMYRGEIRVEIGNYGEYLKVVGGLQIERLQKHLEDILQLLSARSDSIIHCINIATNPECWVSSSTRIEIYMKFVTAMDTLSDQDIQKLTLNSIVALVASPRIVSQDKIDIINFALQWLILLKSPNNAPHRDSVLGSIHIDHLDHRQMLSLVQNLRNLFRKLSESRLYPVHVYLRHKKVVVSGDPKKYAKTNNVIVPRVSSTSSGSLSDDSCSTTCTFTQQHIGTRFTDSQISEIRKLPNFDEHLRVRREAMNGNEQPLLINPFLRRDFFKFQRIPKDSKKHKVAQQQQHPRYGHYHSNHLFHLKKFSQNPTN